MKNAPAIWLWRGYFYKPLSPPQAEELRWNGLSNFDNVQESTQLKFNQRAEIAPYKSFDNFAASHALL